MEKEKQPGRIERYIIAVSIDGQISECFNLEGVKGDTKEAFSSFLNWYLVYRSVHFDNLVADDIGEVIEEAEQLENIGQYMIARHQAVVPIKNDHKEEIGFKKVVAEFFPSKFGMMLKANI